MDGWPAPGVFNHSRHYVASDALNLQLDGPLAYQMGLAGLTVYFAFCGLPCWPPDASTHLLPWCPTCERAWALTWGKTSWPGHIRPQQATCN